MTCNASATVDRALRRSLTPRAARTWSLSRAPLDLDPSVRIDSLIGEEVRDLERVIYLDPAATELDPMRTGTRKSQHAWLGTDLKTDFKSEFDPNFKCL